MDVIPNRSLGNRSEGADSSNGPTPGNRNSRMIGLGGALDAFRTKMGGGQGKDFQKTDSGSALSFQASASGSNAGQVFGATFSQRSSPAATERREGRNITATPSAISSEDAPDRRDLQASPMTSPPSRAEEAQDRLSKIAEYVKYLNAVPEMKTLVAVEKRKIASAMTEHQFPKDHVIYNQGDIGETFYVLKEGTVRILENGIEIRRLVADQAAGITPFFGEKALFRNKPRAGTVVVASTVAKVLALDRESFTLHLGPLEYFFGTTNMTDAEAEPDSDPEEEENRAETRAGDPLAPEHGDPFRMEGGGSSLALDTKKGDGGAFPLDDKLWAMGMLREQLAKSAIAKQRAKQARLARWAPWRIRVYNILHFRAFKVFACFNILLNIVSLCVIVSYPHGHASSLPWTYLALVCKAFFAAEMAVRVLGCAKGRWSGWLRLDLVLVACGTLELLTFPWKSGFVRFYHVLCALQAARVIRFLKLLKKKMMPVRVILTALGSGLSYVFSAALFVGMIWGVAAISFTSLMGPGKQAEDDVRADMERKPELKLALSHFTSTGHSLLSALEITVGGLCWGTTIFEPLMNADDFQLQMGGFSVLVLVILSSFLIWNLVLGIYVRQVTMITKEYEAEEEQEALFEGENSVKNMQQVLERADVDKDGHISKDELHEYLLADAEALQALRLGPQEVKVLHSALDADGAGMVSISDFIFGVLKLTGASKTLDMLSIDYRQKALLRCITQLEKSSAGQLDALSADLDALYAYASYLDKRIRVLHKSVSKAKDDLLTEIDRLGRQAQRARRQAQQNQMLVEARRKQETLQVRTNLETQLKSMQQEVTRLTRERQLRQLLSGKGTELAAIRQAVRQKLETEVGPWLDTQLLAMR